MSKGQDLGLVLGPFFGGLVLSYAYATVTRTLDEKRAVIAELTETRSQLARSEREAGVLSERNRVASELHDTVVQRTASALLMIETAQHLGEGPAAQSTVSAAGEALRETLVETRRLVHGLADPQTRGATVTSALRAEAEAAGAEFVLSGHETLVAEETVHALQRITREALVNAAKHAGSTATRVTVTFFPESVGVDIADAGPGFDPDAVAQREGVGFGLRAMTWRAQNLGGTLSIESRPGGGTVIAASIPLDRADANNSTSTNTNTNTNTASATDREATGTGTQRAESETPS
nr:ATP-binding protein [Leucobacter exalbidus]